MSPNPDNLLRDALSDRYILHELPRLGVWEVIDLHVADPEDAVMFIGVREDCEEWINDPASRPTDKPPGYMGRT